VSFLGREKIPPRSEKETAVKPNLDLMDKAILKNVKENSGANVAKILSPLRSPEWSDPSLRYRLNTLVRDGFLKLEKTRTGRVLVFPIE
jgi:DNA-binding Lrp family transcriptional regulator